MVAVLAACCALQFLRHARFNLEEVVADLTCHCCRMSRLVLRTDLFDLLYKLIKLRIAHARRIPGIRIRGLVAQLSGETCPQFDNATLR